MNTYIGARYVPKVIGAWDANYSYEALSIVTYEGASYTSKRDVPVGIDITNDNYWILTSNYNAQVELYRQEVERLKTEFTDENDITIFISDSYGVSSETKGTNWIERLIEMMGLDSNRYIINAVRGTGFTTHLTDRSANFLVQLQETLVQITDPTKVKRIVVGGGGNDVVDYANIRSNIGSFMRYAKAHFPNAKVFIGFIWGTTSSENINLRLFASQMYSLCGQHGAYYLTGLENVMHNYDAYFETVSSGESTHPNGDGNFQIAYNMLYALNGGSCLPIRRYNPVKFTFADAFGGEEVNFGSEMQTGNVCMLNVTYSQWKDCESMSITRGTWLTLGKLEKLIIKGNNEIYHSGFLRISSDGTTYDIAGRWQIDANMNLRFNPIVSYPNVTRVCNLSMSFEIPSALC